MNIEFEFTENDLIEYYIFHAFHSPTVRVQVLVKHLFVTIFVFMVLVVYNFWVVNNSVFGSFASGVIGAMVVFIFWPLWLEKSVVNKVKRLLKDETTKLLYLQRREILFEPDGVFHKTSIVDAKYKWTAVTKFLQSPKYIYVYIGNESALIVPKRVFSTDMQQKEFINYLQSNILAE